MNSIYSFWWDVTYDWGCDLLLPPGQKSSHYVNGNGHSTQIPPRTLVLPHLHSRSLTLGTHSPMSSDEELKQQLLQEHTRQTHETSLNKGRRYPFGLRPVILLPLAVYPFAISMDLVLRLTWSAKLSSHLHSYSEGDFIIFWIELAEVLRRWMWVFIRVEWEIVKQRIEGSSRSRSPPGGAGMMMADRGRDRNLEDEELEIDMTSSSHFEEKYMHEDG